ncbi:MAG TPA: DUF6011 domain-containing protein [Dissulfurispiraceae bacterium]|nr:DUF6011 domain-containing protein [Dissulfurispiraceae bacterium]
MKPRCKKCGRTLRDPLSIARGMGPECSGAAPIKKGSSRAKVAQKGRSPQSYSLASAIGKTGSVGQAVEKPLNLRRNRAEAFYNREQFTVGKSAFTPLGDERWIDESTQKVIAHQYLEGWLLRYGLIHRSTIQNQNQPVN